MKSSSLPALVALAGLATSCPIAVTSNPACDIPDAPAVPAQNDCTQLLQDLWREDLRAVDVSAGSWKTIACSETCKITVMPREDGTITYGDVYRDARNIIDSCGGPGVALKGEVAGDCQTTRVLKGGDCRG